MYIALRWRPWLWALLIGLIVIIGCTLLFVIQPTWLQIAVTVLQNPSQFFAHLPIIGPFLIAVGVVLALLILVAQLIEHWHKIQGLFDTFYLIFIPRPERTRIMACEKAFTISPVPSLERAAIPMSTYIRRPPLERRLLQHLIPSRRPKVVELIGGVGSGETRLLHELIVRELADRYRGRIVFFDWSDRKPDEIVAPTFRQIALRQIEARLRRAQLGMWPDSHESIDDPVLMNAAPIAAIFHRTSWLIVLIGGAESAIDPALIAECLGQQNTVVFAHQTALSRNQKEHIYAQTLLTAGQMKAITIPKLNRPQAVELLMQFCRRDISRTDRPIIAAHIAGSTPGFIKQLAYLYISSRGQPLGVSGSFAIGDIEQGNMTLYPLFKEHIDADQQRFLILLFYLTDGNILHELPATIIPAMLLQSLLHAPRWIFSAKDHIAADPSLFTQRQWRSLVASAITRHYILRPRDPHTLQFTLFGFKFASDLAADGERQSVEDVQNVLLHTFLRLARSGKLRETSDIARFLRFYVGLNPLSPYDFPFAPAVTFEFAYTLRDHLLAPALQRRGNLLLQHGIEAARYLPEEAHRAKELAQMYATISP